MRVHAKLILSCATPAGASITAPVSCILLLCRLLRVRFLLALALLAEVHVSVGCDLIAWNQVEPATEALRLEEATLDGEPNCIASEAQILRSLLHGHVVV